jgi:Ran GTPase-activating protein (RanGAP) involved in mRNA processing and transport
LQHYRTGPVHDEGAPSWAPFEFLNAGTLVLKVIPEGHSPGWMVRGSSTSEVLQPPDAGEVLQRLGVSDVVVRQSATLGLAWKNLTPADGKLAAQLLPTAMELVEIDLRHNHLGDLGCAAIIEGLHQSGSRRIATLRLARNGISDKGGAVIASFIGETSPTGRAAALRVLDLSLNALRDDTAIGSALGINKSLTDLDLTSNALRSGKAIAAGLSSNRTLVTINLLFNRLDLESAYELASVTRASRAHGVPRTLCGVPADASAIELPRRGMTTSDGILLAAELESAHNVKHVDLSHNALGPQAAAALGEALRASSTITSLNLQANRLAGVWMTFGDEVGSRDDKGVVALAGALADAPSLTSLNLSGNTLGEAGARAIARAAAKACEGGLRWLHVGEQGEALPVQHLRGQAAGAASSGAGGTMLSLGGRQLDDLDAVVISQLISANTRLTALDLSGASIGAMGCTALAAGLSSASCSLTKLDLRGPAMLGEAGKLAIGAALLTLNSAKVGCLSCEAFSLGSGTASLDLPGKKLSAGDVALLAGVLRHNVALFSLDLSHTALNVSSCAVLCLALSKNGALRELDLYGNQVADEGARHLAEVLRVNATLTSLSVGMNQMSAEGVRRVTHALDSNSSVVELSLDNNGASYFTEAHCERMLLSNRRSSAMRRHLPALASGEMVPQTRLTVHICGEPGSGRSILSMALRRSGVGQKAAEGEDQSRDRGVVQLVHKYESRVFELIDYGGKTEFALMNHRHHDRNARAVMAPAVYLVLVNLMNGVEQCALELRWWRRFIKAGSPRGMAPSICLIGSRGDKAPKAQSLLNEIRHRADADGKELPEITAAFQFDCRGAAWPLRDWYVSWPLMTSDDL